MARAHESADDLLLSETYRLPVFEKAVSLLNLPPGSFGLEVGCGIGSVTLLLARTVGPRGRVIGLDRDGDLLDLARERAEEAGLGGRASFEQGDMTALAWSEDAFDWLISVDCAGYAPSAEPRTLVKELARVLKPGGLMALMAWSSQMLLPGHPALEARLNATPAGMAPFSAGRPPEDHFSRALGWLEGAGLRNCRAATLAGQIQAPLDPGEKAALAALLAMRWPGAEKELESSEADLFRKLTDPTSPECLLHQPDYLAFFTYTLFQGRKPEEA